MGRIFKDKDKETRIEPDINQTPLDPSTSHLVLGTPIHSPFPADTEKAVFGMGCFWGAERIFWQLSGVHTTAVGYVGGYIANPSYEKVCSGKTGHAEVVLVVYHPDIISYEYLLTKFFEGHDPTQGMRQGNDVGTQYRSLIQIKNQSQRGLAVAMLDAYQQQLSARQFGKITTEIIDDSPFYYAEDYHQQYLAANPSGYCGLGGTGISCPTSL